MLLSVLKIILLAALSGLLTACDFASQTPPEHGAGDPLPSGSYPPGTDFLSAIVQWQATAPEGLSLHHLQDSADSELLLAEIDASRFAPELIAAPGDGVSLRQNTFDADVDAPLSVVIGSGFVTGEDQMQPLGLLQLQGAILNPVEPHGYTRILGIHKARLQVIHKSAFTDTLFEAALQVGPGIIEQGQLDISERDLQRPRYFRAILAICAERYIAGVSLIPMNLRTLGESSQAFFRRQGWQCDEMVNFAGDRQAGLLVSMPGQTLFHGYPETLKASYLGFRKKT